MCSVHSVQLLEEPRILGKNKWFMMKLEFFNKIQTRNRSLQWKSPEFSRKRRERMLKSSDKRMLNYYYDICKQNFPRFMQQLILAQLVKKFPASYLN
jgi:hypothetical protein